ncbi:MAG: hypothetical protein Aurels2KO_54420 [Aureliella sp.]
MKFSTKFAASLLALSTTFAVGCGDSETADALPLDADAAMTDGDDAADASSSEAPAGSIALTPSNTTIQFVGNHTGEDKKPRTCKFGALDGSIAGEGELAGLMVEIKTDSLETEFDDLTSHLKNADFFDVKRYPTAKFVATSIVPGDDGEVSITGDLTLLGQTHSLTFPAKFSPDADPMLTASFEIDRTQWGMNYGPDKIEKMVEMTITVNK